MKRIILVSLLLIGASGVFAQSTYESSDGAVCKKFPHMPANAQPVWPKGAYTPTQDASCPPCYEYTSKHGVKIMECPYLNFPAERSTASADNNQDNYLGNDRETNLGATTGYTVQTQSSYTGHYPSVCKKDPDMPANAKPVWPKGEYTPLEAQACPPCYEYTSKHGVKIMECPFLRFPAEHDNQ